MSFDWLTATIKAAVSEHLTETCFIEAQAESYDEYGQAIPGDRNTVASDVACRLIDLGERLQAKAGRVGDQETIVDTYRLIVPVGTGIAKDQIVTIGGIEYHVVDRVTDRTAAVDEQAVVTRRS